MNAENIFSFRMFDLYRRFVEIIQKNEEFLKEFKTGFPSEEICRDIIGKTFQHRQPEDKMSNMVDYLRKNAPILVAHAENLPDTWNTAVRYTDWCISEIKRYLKNKNISIKANFATIPDLSKEIGKCIYKNGANQKQIEIIEEYLKEDIKNPKRSTVCSQKSKKCKRKEKILSPIPLKEKQVVIIENEETNSIISVDVHDESSETQISTPQSFLREDLLKTEFTAEIEDLLQPQGHQSTNELLHIASPGESNEFVLQKNDLIQLEKSDKDVIETCDTEDIQSILENSKCESEENEFIILEITEESDISKDKTEYSSNITTPADYYVTVNSANSNKRRIVSSSENCTKKLFISDEVLNNENPQYITVSTDDNIKNSTWNSVQYLTVSNDGNLRRKSSDSVQILNTTGNERIRIDESHDSISDIIVDKENEENINCEKENEQNINTNNNQKEVQNKMMDVSEIKTEPEVKQENGTCTCMEFQNRAPYIEETVKYSDIMNMSYTEALKIMEKILAFCELKNEISLEEFLVLRRTRDKMHWRSLKEKTPLK